MPGVGGQEVMTYQTNNLRPASGDRSWADGNFQDSDQAEVEPIFQKLVWIWSVNNFPETSVNRPAADVNPLGFLAGRPSSKARQKEPLAILELQGLAALSFPLLTGNRCYILSENG